MDALSDVLKSLRFEGAVYLNSEFTAPWCVWSSFGLSSIIDRLGAAEHVMFFHFVVEGSCKLRLADGTEVLQATAGDLVLFPRDDKHLMGSDLHLAPVEGTALVNCGDTPAPGFIHLRHGGGGAVARFVCGFVACNRGACRPLIDALPRMLRIPIGDGPASALLRDLLRAGVNESNSARPGGESVLAKLSELMVVEALRRYALELPSGDRGLLAGMRDPHIGRALALIHGEPDRGWTVDDLAREVALSRSALADRFAALVGEPPMQYLLRWRLALAARMLRSGREALVRVAERSGYESQAAFSRAFKREFGMPPAAWRRAVATR